MTLDLRTIRYEVLDGGIARVTMNRPEARNAQNRRMTYELDAAFTEAAFDDDVKVIILAGEGPHFSAGHDLRDTEDYDLRPIGISGGFAKGGAEGHMAFEEEIYFNMCRRWQQLPKPTIAQVHGKTIAGGLMLMWVCDLIVASDDATFSDPVVAFGVNGHEYFVHAWELGARKAKELLFTGASVTAEEARQLGMVNHVVARDELESFTLALAERIASRPSMGLKLAKVSVNQSLDLQGQRAAVEAAFSLHQLGHSHNQQRFGMAVDPEGVAVIREGR